MGTAGSDAERRFARDLKAQLESLGREAEIEPTRIRPAFALTHLIHALVAVVASVLAVYTPLLGLVVLAFVTASAFGELTAAFPAVRLLTGARASQNVVSDEDNGKPGLLVLVAHYDAPRGGLLLESSRLRRWPTALFWSLVVIALCAALRVFGLDGTFLTIVQFIPTVLLIGLSPLFADVMLSDGRPGDASEASTVLRLTETFGGRLEHFDVMAVFTGASAHFALGMRAWLRRHRKDLDAEATAVIVVDGVHGGTPHYAAKEGPVFATRLHPTLIDLCEDDAEPYTSRELSDAYVARAAGLPTIRIASRTTKGAEIDSGPDAPASVYDCVAALIKRIDAEIGPRLA